MPKHLIDPPYKIDLTFGGTVKPSNSAQAPVQKPTEKAKSDKFYMLVLYFNDGTGESEVTFVKGQANARATLINRIDEIDVYESFVLVEDVPFGSRDGKPSVLEFLQWIQDNYSDGFDPEDYSLHKKQEVEEFERMQRIMGDGGVDPTYQPQQITDLFNNSNSKEIW